MRYVTFRWAASLLVALIAAGAITGCNTINGLGEDLQAGGRAVSHTAAEVQSDLRGNPAPQAPAVGIEQARALALGARPGTITEEELEREHGRLRYAFDIRSEGVTYDVEVDASTGAIIENEREGR